MPSFGVNAQNTDWFGGGAASLGDTFSPVASGSFSAPITTPKPISAFSSPVGSRTIVHGIDDRRPGTTTMDAINGMIDTYHQTHYSQYDQHGGSIGGGFSGDVGTVGTLGSPVDQWSSGITAAANKFGVPANLIASVMQLESGGVNRGTNGAGATGLMQVVGSIWGDLGYDLNDPNQNIMAGADILKQFHDEYSGWATANGVDPWKAAVYAYYAGNPYDLSAHDDPNQGGSGMSTGAYGDQIWNTFTKLQGMTGPGAGMGAPGGTSNTFGSIIGGGTPNISQEFGWTDFARNSDYANSGAYNYTADYTRDRQPMGHAGVDVALNYGSRLYAPVGGTVSVSGGSGYYCDVEGNGCGAGVGQLSITLDNGDILILGHMSNIGVPVGTRVSAGQLVGLSGSENGGHVHVEYRKWVGAGVTNSGWEEVDPRNVLGGAFTGSYDGSSVGSQYAGMSPVQIAMSGGLQGGGKPWPTSNAFGGSGWGNRIASLMGG